MKIKYRDTNDVFWSIWKAKNFICEYPACGNCPISHMNNSTDQSCVDFCREHPAEAVKLMGFEIIED